MDVASRATIVALVPSNYMLILNGRMHKDIDMDKSMDTALDIHPDIDIDINMDKMRQQFPMAENFV